MAVLSDERRAAVTRKLEREWSLFWEFIGISSQDLRAAVNAYDQYLQDTQADANDALPPAAKANLSNKLKALLAIGVIEERYEVDHG